MSNEPEEDAKKRRPGVAASLQSGVGALKYIAAHTVAEGESLSDISLKYYHSAVKEKWMKIYRTNRILIGDDPGKVKVGQVLKIPELESE